MRASVRSVLAAAAVTAISFCAAGCGSSVKGHTYAGPNGMVQVAFQSDGKAFASMGPMTSACTYTQKSNKISLICEGDTEELTLGSDGALTGPPEGMLARLTKVK